ncbi:N,N-dimethylformamidase beta subunit family domain-containing protein [Gordonia sp. C13]|uniref:N,N-dimethylformamidase beta subunit family domain-containing protein n=1 Tax=Gordonia sp. C13 TaxID=2935078 RepID=UPI00200B6A51|nr:N,N-dimethylformamidase beta subunit family domain-containing protein [Gordonia sp. C13]MCK8615511.1 LamG domain-containing protein [Gordonia sp. C13]
MTKPQQPRLLSYTDRLSVAPGEPIEFKVSSLISGRFEADIVRLRHGDRNPAGPGFREDVIESEVTGSYPARVQDVDSGSFIRVDDEGKLALTGSFTLHAYVCPTTPAKDQQVVMGKYDLGAGVGYALELGPEGVGLRVGDGVTTDIVSTGEALYGSCWYSIGATFDPVTREAAVWSISAVNEANSLVASTVELPGIGRAVTELNVAPAPTAAPFAIAAASGGGRFDAHFNGKIERPGVWNRVLDEDEVADLVHGMESRVQLAALWDFAASITTRGITTDRARDIGPWGLHGFCEQGPARGMTGRWWRGVDERYTLAPNEYGAIHFHDDDLEDCHWDTDIRWTVPADLRSGTYALRITQDGETDRQPFFVTPPRGIATADVVLVVATASYLAYANEHLAPGGAFAQSIFGQTPVLGASDLYLHEHPELGLSLYDLHSDGSGVHLSSSRRPIVNLRPDKRTSLGGPWQFPADLHLVDWLTEKNIAFDVVTDLEVHQEGADLLNRYRVVLTGSHPEYISRETLDAWEAYLSNGGRALYLGGNGFYWVTNWHPEKPHVIEVRRGESGIRAWQAQPGELHLQTNGERGGLWRWRGRAPQKIVGTGFATQGFDFSSYFVQTDDVTDPLAAFVVDGIDRDEKIGDFGLEGGGASGFELDRYDLTLGTPPNTRLLAHSVGHSDNYPRVSEEVQFTMPHMGATMDYQARGDITFFPTRNGGGVFSASSIAWCGSLSHNEYDNNVSRMTENVIKRFLEPEPLDVPRTPTTF